MDGSGLLTGVKAKQELGPVVSNPVMTPLPSSAANWLGTPPLPPSTDFHLVPKHTRSSA